MNKEYMPVQPEVSDVGLVLGVAEAIVKTVVNFGKMVVEDNPRPKEKPVEKSSELEILIIRAQLKALMEERAITGSSYTKAEAKPVLSPHVESPLSSLVPYKLKPYSNLS